MLAQAVVAAA